MKLKNQRSKIKDQRYYINQQPTTNNQQPRSGFTLIEVLVAATIIGLLSTIGLTGFQAITRSGRDAVRKSDLEQIRSALEIYKSENNFYPTPVTTCMPDLSAGYINNYPVDPKPTQYQYCYKQNSNLSYSLYAHLENSISPTVAIPGGCNRSGSGCNYQVNNP